MTKIGKVGVAGGDRILILSSGIPNSDHFNYNLIFNFYFQF
jgi:hypothetical protein